MTLYFDTSAIVSLFLEEARSGAVNYLVASAKTIISDFAAGEFSAAISTAVRTGRVVQSDAINILDRFDFWHKDAVQQVGMTSQDLIDATTIVRRFDLGLLLPDSLHLAICRRLGATLVSGDGRQCSAAFRLGLDVSTV